MTKKNIPACVTCRHFQRATSGCLRKTYIDPVNGKVVDDVEWCWDERRDRFPLDVLRGTCGRRGRFWTVVIGKPASSTDGGE